MDLLAGLPRHHYGLILADPPWHFRLRSAKGEGKSPQRHYRTMTLPDIQALPVADLAARDCALVMWATSPLLPEAMETLACWGFAYKATGVWAKQSSTGRRWQFGTGYGYRSAAEFWLLGTRGAPKRISRSIRNLIVAPVREHSRKPDQMHADLEALFPGPRLELFGREAREGWTVRGNEVGKFGAVRAMELAA